MITLHYMMWGISLGIFGLIIGTTIVSPSYDRISYEEWPAWLVRVTIYFILLLFAGAFTIGTAP